MITNKLKINDSKTEFIVFRSPQLRCDLSGLSVNVGESEITQSSKVRYLGVTFDKFLNFYDHITAICQMAPPARTITVALDTSKAFDTINIHTLIRKLLQTNIPGTIIKFIANYIKDAKPTQHIEITHPNNVNLKLAFHKVASFHPHYSTFTPQTYHHPVHRFRSWPMQMTSQSHPHTQVRVQPRNTYNHTYTKFLPGQNKTTSY